MNVSALKRSLSQERIVLVLAIALFIGASLMLPGFFQADNLVSIVRSVSILGILAVGVIGLVLKFAAKPSVAPPAFPNAPHAPAYAPMRDKHA